MLLLLRFQLLPFPVRLAHELIEQVSERNHSMFSVSLTGLLFPGKLLIAMIDHSFHGGCWGWLGGDALGQPFLLPEHKNPVQSLSS